jgi:hypothetical protein
LPDDKCSLSGGVNLADKGSSAIASISLRAITMLTGSGGRDEVRTTRLFPRSPAGTARASPEGQAVPGQRTMGSAAVQCSRCFRRPVTRQWARRRVRIASINNLLTIPSATWPCQWDRGTLAMESLPPWALWIIAAAVGLSPGLAFLMVGMISRFSHRTLWPRSKAAAGFPGAAVRGSGP